MVTDLVEQCTKHKRRATAKPNKTEQHKGGKEPNEQCLRLAVPYEWVDSRQASMIHPLRLLLALVGML